jgi:hypothetical protein
LTTTALQQLSTGTIKVKYVKKAIAELKSRPPSKRLEGLLQALNLALTLKKMYNKVNVTPIILN